MDTFTANQLDIIRNNVKSERVRCGYTQEDLAKVLEISKSAYSKLEQGQRTFSLEHLITISNFLNVELPSLLKMQGKEDDILNQSEEKRKRFLKELLMTFGIGAKPQKEYSMREISALITFIRAYGHSLPYAPHKLKDHLLYTGKASSEIIASVEEIIAIYEKGLPEKYEEVEKLLSHEQKVMREVFYLQQQKEALEKQLAALQEQNEREASPTLNKYQIEIDAQRERLAALQEQSEMEASPTLNKYQQEIDAKKSDLSLLNNRIGESKRKLSSLADEITKYERIIELHKKTVAEIEENKKSSPIAITDGTGDSELKQKYEKLLAENKAMLEELDIAYEQIDRFDTEAIEDEIQEQIDMYISENYHNISGDDFNLLVENLLFFAQVYATIRRKYKSVGDDPYKFAKATVNEDDYEIYELTDISDVLRIVDAALDWELEH